MVYVIPRLIIWSLSARWGWKGRGGIPSTSPLVPETVDSISPLSRRLPAWPSIFGATKEALEPRLEFCGSQVQPWERLTGVF